MSNTPRTDAVARNSSQSGLGAATVMEIFAGELEIENAELRAEISRLREEIEALRKDSAAGSRQPPKSWEIKYEPANPWRLG